MSYILDALRKADAQRESSPARGIHAQPVTVIDGRKAAGWPLLAGGAVLVVGVAIAVALWSMNAQRPAPGLAPVAQQPAQSVLPPAPPPPLTGARAPTMPAAQALSVAPAPAASASPTVQPQPPATADRVLTVAELPPEVQRELPRLPISGGVYSENAAQRMLIVNGQVVNEGAELAPGLVLEQIRAKSAVLRFRGLRYSVPY